MGKLAELCDPIGRGDYTKDKENKTVIFLLKNARTSGVG